MPATFAFTASTGNGLLDAIDSGRKWTGEITLNRVDPGNAAETQQFASTLPSDYVTTGAGVSESMWSAITRGLATMRTYANVSFSVTDGLDANYLVSDFSKPTNPNTAGISGEPGKGPIIAFNPQTWGTYSPQIQQWITLHELGHVLGLSHVAAGLPETLNYAQRTIMSYNWVELSDPFLAVGLPLTPTALDVAVLQAKYGAAEANIGATTYALSSLILDLDGSDGAVQNGRGFVTIWDSGGLDTLASTGATNAVLNLNAATLSTAALTGDLGAVIGEVAQTSRIFAGLSSTARNEIVDPAITAGGFLSGLYIGGVRQAHGFTIASGAVIENAAAGGGNDLLIGNAGANRLAAGGGADELFGGGGDDSLDGGAGDDRLFGGTGADTVSDASGSNYLRGGEGDDSVLGGAGFDDIHGNQGADTCVSDGGDDWVVGGQGNDCLQGGAGQNLVYGNIGDDTLDGGDGFDVVRGGQGSDWVYGGRGDDFVSGDLGDDTMIGGIGADTFHVFEGAGRDQVMEFWAPEGDRVMVAAGSAYTVAQVGADAVVTLNGAQLVLLHTTLGNLPDGWIYTA